MAKEEKKQLELIRIMGTDIRTSYNMLYGLAQIKGVSIMFSNALCTALKLDKTRKIESLSEKEVEKIEEYLSNPKKKDIPKWILNQRKEYETGEDIHLTGKDLEFNLMQLKRRVGKLKTYKSLRYKSNLPVRGQRTRSNFRRNKMLNAMKSKKSGGKN